MKSVKLAVVYVVSIGFALACIASVLHFGPSLAPARSASMATLERTLAASGDVSVLAVLREQAGSPLGRLFIQLLLMVGACRLMAMASRRLGFPSVAGEMAAGLLLGPSLLGWLAPRTFEFVFPPQSLQVLGLFSQVGICLFMFAVGMEVNPTHLRTQARTAVAVSHASIVVPFVLGVLLACFLFEDLAGPRATFDAFALFMGISMSITAFPVLARILQERRLSATALGSTAITCAAVDDLTAWTILAFVICVSRAITMEVALVTLLLALLFVAVMTVGVRRLLLRVLGSEAHRQTPSSSSLAVVICVIVAAALATEAIGIHALFGAFLAGAIMPQFGTFRAQISARVQEFSSVLLVPLFFAFTGLRTEIGLLRDIEGWLVCGLIIMVATAGKLGASAIAARITGMSWRDSLRLGALMNTRGLMELIALNIGYDLGVLSPRIFTMLVVMALVTTLLTGPLLTLFSRPWKASDRDETSPLWAGKANERPRIGES